MTAALLMIKYASLPALSFYPRRLKVRSKLLFRVEERVILTSFYSTAFLFRVREVFL